MAKTVDNYSTINEFREKYNELAVDVGEVSGLRPALGENLVENFLNKLNKDLIKPYYSS